GTQASDGRRPSLSPLYDRRVRCGPGNDPPQGQTPCTILADLATVVMGCTRRSQRVTLLPEGGNGRIRWSLHPRSSQGMLHYVGRFNPFQISLIKIMIETDQHGCKLLCDKI